MAGRVAYLVLLAIAAITLDIVHGENDSIASCEATGCGDGFVCSQGRCIDRCAVVRCRADTCCFRGVCHNTNVTCEDHVCGQGEECYITETCPPEKKCRPPSCEVTECDDGFLCYEGSCIDRCAAVRCRADTCCFRGVCHNTNVTCEDHVCAQGEECYITETCPPEKKCRPPSCEVTECDDGFLCYEGSCIDKCAAVECLTGSCCIRGMCYNTNVTCEDHVCGQGEECYITETCPPEKKCRPILTCSTILCITGTTCLNNECLPNMCTNTTCNPDEDCYLQPGNDTYPTLAHCAPRDLCASVTCETGYKCWDGECFPSCELVDCPAGQICYEEPVTCVKAPCPPIPTCKEVPSCDGVDCGPGNECYLEEVQCFTTPCYPIPSCRADACATIRCASPNVCKGGKCVCPTSTTS